jgi:hypothetical protein
MAACTGAGHTFLLNRSSFGTRGKMLDLGACDAAGQTPCSGGRRGPLIPFPVTVGSLLKAAT